MNKFLIPLLMSATAVAGLTGCSSKKDQLIDKPDFHTTDSIFDIEALEALGRVTNPKVSPDGSKILYAVSYESVEQNKSNNDLWVMNADGSDKRRVTKTPGSEGEAAWLSDERIAFVAETPDVGDEYRRHRPPRGHGSRKRCAGLLGVARR